jgi:hypothetical protein
MFTRSGLYKEECATCGGQGVVEDWKREIRRCEDCDGFGVALTENGRELVRFLERAGLPLKRKGEAVLR